MQDNIRTVRTPARPRGRWAAIPIISLLFVGVQPAVAGAGCTVSIEDATVTEADSGTTDMVFTIGGNCGSGEISYETVARSAAAGSDFVASSGTATFDSVDPAETIVVPIVGDVVPEFPETFELVIDSDTVPVSSEQIFGKIHDTDNDTDVVVFNNGDYINVTDGDEGSEGLNVPAALEAFGHNVTTTDAITAAGLGAALAGKDALVIPEREESDTLGAALDEPAREVIRDFVAAGNSIVVMFEAEEFLNAVFGYSVVETGAADSVLTTDAAGTEFELLPERLADLNATNAVDVASLPEGSKVIYGHGGIVPDGMQAAAVDPATLTAAEVAVIPEGDGSVVYLGYDWYNSSPGFDESDPGNTDGQDGGWSIVLDAAVELPVLTISDASTNEGDSGTTAVAQTVSINHKVSEVVSGAYATANGLATAGSDYVAKTGTISIPRGSTSAAISTVVNGDEASEPDENYTVALTDVIGAVPTDPSGTVTIVSDDVQTFESGYRLVASDGGVFTFGDRNFHGSTGDLVLNKPMVGGATDNSDYDGYWLVASDGGVFTFNAPFFGSLADQSLTSPAVEIEPTPTGKGYWIVLANGKVYTFGDASHFGDMSGKPLNKPIIGMSVTPSGKGYWLVAGDGGIFNFGDAGFFGSMGDKPLNAPIIDLGPSVDNLGYYLLGSDGGVFTFGSADFKGSTGGMTLNSPVVAILVSPNGAGYWLGAADGGVFTFGSIPFLGSMGGIKLNGPVLDFIN